MKLWRGTAALAVGLIFIVQAQTLTSINGRIFNSRGAPVWGALIKLKSSPTTGSYSDVLGNFKLDSSTHISATRRASPSVHTIPLVFSLEGRTINFQTSHAGVGKISLFTPAGKRVVALNLGKLDGGMHSASLPLLSSGLYILNIQAGSALFSGPVVNTSGNMRLGMKSSVSPTGITAVPMAAVAVVDSLIITKGGYTASSVALATYQDTVVDTLHDACPDFAVPDSLHLDSITYMPDPFLSLDGTRLTDKDQWACRRAQIKALMEKYEYGPYPPAPDSVRGTYSGTTLTVYVYYQGNSQSFTSTVTLPSGTGRCGAWVGVAGFPSGFSSQLVANGIATLSYNPTGIASDDTTKTGIFWKLYGKTQQTGSLLAWAWGVHRILDALYAVPRIDPLRIGVTGTSRDGKGALITGAFDERICVTMPHCGGSGACETWRIATKGDYPPISNNSSVQTLNQVTTEAPHWWVRTFKANFGLKEYKLPFDAHEGLALVAPRPLLVLETTGDYWNCPSACWNGAKGCQQVYRFLGVPDYMGFASCSGGHATFGANMDSAALHFANRFINGQQNVPTVWFDSTNTPGAVPDTVKYPGAHPYFAIRDSFAGPSYWTAPGFTTW